MKIIILSSLIFGLNFSALAKDCERSFAISMTNDNPFLNVLPKSLQTEDDTGYTFGLAFKNTSLCDEGSFSNHERTIISYSSDLYTHDETPTGEDLFPNVPQTFNEISALKITKDNKFDTLNSRKFYRVIGVGIGYQNDKNIDSAAGGVLLQRKWHGFKSQYTPDQTPTYKYVPGNSEEFYGSVHGALGKVITFNDNMKNCNCEMDQITFQGGAEVLTVHDGSRIYLLAEVDKSVLQTENTTTSIKASSQANAYGDGNYDMQNTLGLEFKRRKWTFETGMTFISGPQNEEFLQHVDDDAIWYGKAERKY